MAEPLRVLLLEDRLADARLIAHALRQDGFELQWDRVETEADYAQRLDASWDVILADYSLPQFDAIAALKLLRERGDETPFIIVSGSIGEDTAVEAMKQGASDYLLKDRLVRLGSAVRQALDQRRLKQAELAATQALNESRERMRLLLDTAYDAFIGVDMDGKITDWNKQAEKTFGWSREEAVGRGLAETIIPVKQRTAFYAGLDRYRNGAASTVLNRQLELTAIRRDGSEFPVEATVWPVRIGQTETFGAFVRDITDRRRLEQQIRQSQKMEAIGRLAGGVAHDFNNLLTVITGYSDIAIAQLGASNSLLEILEEIRKAALRAGTLTRQLLAFSRKQVLMPVLLDLNELVHDMERMLGRLIGEDIDLAIRPAADLWPVRVDAGQMEQVLMNLIVNARDAMPSGGKLTIETSNVVLDAAYAARHADARPGGHVVIAVSDMGVGMDQATLAKIFEPFFTTKSPDRGTGLGLATVYGIVKQSGGHITVYSEPGRGSCFKIYLPSARETAAADSAAPKTAADLRGNETVLLVEDEDGVRGLARAVLAERGYRVLEARDGREAMKLTQEASGPIHLLATDVVMPRMSGRELAERLAPLRPEMKVLYLSGYMDDAIVRHGLLAAGIAFLHKPYTPGALAAKVREVLDAPAGPRVTSGGP